MPSARRLRSSTWPCAATDAGRLGHRTPRRAWWSATTSPSKISRRACATIRPVFRLANQRGGIVVGTCDLGARPRLVDLRRRRPDVALQRQRGRAQDPDQHLIRWEAGNGEFETDVNDLLREIVEQEITPELIPTREDELPQSTEMSVGPYNLQDFTLFHVIRRGARPSRIAFLSWHAWKDASAGDWPPSFPASRRVAYDLGEVRHWLDVFIRRFFAAQFKRSAHYQRPQGRGRRHHVAARRLADAIQRQPGGVAGGAGERAHQLTLPRLEPRAEQVTPRDSRSLPRCSRSGRLRGRSPRRSPERVSDALTGRTGPGHVERARAWRSPSRT